MPSKRYSTDIPGARVKLADIALRLYQCGQEDIAREIIDIIHDNMTQRYAPRITPIRHSVISPATVARVKELAKTTDMSQQQIAVECNLNAGRVSEILSGMRGK